MRVSTNQYQQTSLNALLDQQSKLSRVQEQLSTGRRILQPSDDPAGSARALELAKSVETIERYNRNADFAESRMRTEESVLNETGDLLQRVRELAVQASNDTATAEDRQTIGAEVRERLDQLVQLANSTDGNGEYLFAGGQTRTRPFVDADGAVNYEGDQKARRVQVGPGRQMASTHSGFEVFMKVPNGDGERVTAAADGNTGTGAIGSAAVDNAAALVAGAEYEIQFGAGGDTYSVTRDGGATTVVPPGTAYEAGEPIAFEGLSVTVDGQPANTDSFTVEPSRAQSLFETVERFASALENAGSTAPERASFRNAVDRTLQDLDQAQEGVLEVRAEVGARLNALDSERTANETAVLELKTTKSEIEDLNYAEAATRLNQRLTGLQAAQQSYSKIQGLSLFNYL